MLEFEIDRICKEHQFASLIDAEVMYFESRRQVWFSSVICHYNKVLSWLIYLKYLQKKYNTPIVPCSSLS